VVAGKGSQPALQKRLWFTLKARRSDLQMPGRFDHERPVAGSERKDADSLNVAKDDGVVDCQEPNKAEKLHESQMS
jgi:hypothetical protein